MIPYNSVDKFLIYFPTLFLNRATVSFFNISNIKIILILSWKWFDIEK